MTPEIFFDNSALSRLMEEPNADRDALVAGLRILGTLRVTSLNVLETAKTPDSELRARKLAFYRSVSRTVAPIDEPAEILAMTCRAYHDRTGLITTGNQYLFNLLEEPSMATEDLRVELARWAKDQEQWFDRRHAQMRARFDETFAHEPIERFATGEEFVQFVFENASDTLRSLVPGLYRDATGTELPAGEIARFLDDAWPVKTYIAAQLHALWVGAVSERMPGTKRAGAIDTDSAVYLGLCDVFITHDVRQAETLRSANTWNRRHTSIEMYHELRTRLII